MRVTLHTTVDSDVSPELIITALLDFGEDRPDIWPTLDPKTFRVHCVDETTAEVTEGSPYPKVWSRERYDSSEPTTISWTAVESNFCTPGSHVSMDIVTNGDGGSQVDVTCTDMCRYVRPDLRLVIICTHI